MTMPRMPDLAAGQEMESSRRETDLKYAVAVAICGIIVGLTYHMRLWDVDARGLSSAQDRLPYWDFSNLWMGGRLALEGRVDTLFDAEAYRAALRQIFSSDLPDQEWSYPPSMLLFGAPIAVLPILPAYLIWTFGTIFAIWLAIRPFKLPVSLQMAIILSPAVMMNALFGQNGALTAALLIGGLAVAPKRPILAGILFGLLTVKPHLGCAHSRLPDREWKLAGDLFGRRDRRSALARDGSCLRL